MPGIASGAGYEHVDDEIFGDVVIENCVWNYSNGKYGPANRAEIVFGELGFISRPSFTKVNPELLPVFEKVVNSADNQCCVHFEAIASGSTVVANQIILDKQILSKYQDTKGLKMEGTALFMLKSRYRAKAVCYCCKEHMQLCRRTESQISIRSLRRTQVVNLCVSL